MPAPTTPADHRVRARELAATLTLEEKAALVGGRDVWTTVPVEREGIPSIWMSDGPHGLRRTTASDGLFGAGTMPSTCFPTAVLLAASWDRDLVRRVGAAIGTEARSGDVQVVLGPGVNIKRSPLGGRNFEYFSEDPFLAGELAAAFIDGVQSTGVGTSLKHYAANSQELDRMNVDARMDERTLREIYLPAFEAAVKRAQPWTVMCSYNRLNGIHASQHRKLLTTILRDEWGFEGLVVSDWGAVNDRVAGVKAGLDLEMPGSGAENVVLVAGAVRDGILATAELDRAATNVIALALAGEANRDRAATFDEDAHHALAREAAAASVVLLKNDRSVLPLRDDLKRIAVIGRFAKRPRIQGAGSSRVNPTRTDNAWDELSTAYGGATLTFAEGYGADSAIDDVRIREAVEAARGAEVALVFAGVPAGFEAEGQDRSGLGLPLAHDALIEAVLAEQPNTVVILTAGSAVASPWMERAPAIVFAGLAGQGGAHGVGSVLRGDVCPSGRLAETFPARIEDTSAFHDFPGRDQVLNYGDGVFVGYRWHDARAIAPLFAFGHGLSYTSFEYADLRVMRVTGQAAEVSVVVRNTGPVGGAEVVQLYVRDVASTVARPPQELKGFEKVWLGTGEEATVTFALDSRAFSSWDEWSHGWVVERGEFEIRVGASSRDIRLTATLELEGDEPRRALTRLSPIRDVLAAPGGMDALRALTGREPGQGGLIDAPDVPVIKVATFSRGAISSGDVDRMLAGLNTR
jgi:beta-glucosidase